MQQACIAVHRLNDAVAHLYRPLRIDVEYAVLRSVDNRFIELGDDAFVLYLFYCFSGYAYCLHDRVFARAYQPARYAALSRDADGGITAYQRITACSYRLVNGLFKLREVFDGIECYLAVQKSAKVRRLIYPVVRAAYRYALRAEIATALHERPYNVVAGYGEVDERHLRQYRAHALRCEAACDNDIVGVNVFR